MPTRWFPDGNESIFSQTSLTSKEPGLAGEKKAHIAHRCISSESRDEQMVTQLWLEAAAFPDPQDAQAAIMS
jgi:hypothetical protein